MGQFGIRMEVLGFMQRFHPKHKRLMQSLIDYYLNFWPLFD